MSWRMSACMRMHLDVPMTSHACICLHAPRMRLHAGCVHAHGSMRAHAARFLPCWFCMLHTVASPAACQRRARACHSRRRAAAAAQRSSIPGSGLCFNAAGSQSLSPSRQPAPCTESLHHFHDVNRSHADKSVWQWLPGPTSKLKGYGAVKLARTARTWVMCSRSSAPKPQRPRRFRRPTPSPPARSVLVHTVLTPYHSTVRTPASGLENARDHVCNTSGGPCSQRGRPRSLCRCQGQPGIRARP